MLVATLTGFVKGKKVLRKMSDMRFISPWLFVPMLLVYENDGWRAIDLSNRMDYDHSNVRRMMGRLVDAGLAYRDTDKGYHLTSNGRLVVEETLRVIRDKKRSLGA